MPQAAKDDRREGLSGPRSAVETVARDLVIWGASGHARVLHDFIDTAGYRLVALFDNDPTAHSPFPDVPILHGSEAFVRWLRARGDPHPPSCLVAVGGGKGRERLELQRSMENQGCHPAVVVHPFGYVAASATIGAGGQVLANASVCSSAKLGPACIVNTGASVDHESALERGVHVAPGATLCGLVTVGEFSLVGPGAVVLPGLNIGARVVVGAGAVVTRDVPDDTVVYGNPARPVR